MIEKCTLMSSVVVLDFNTVVDGGDAVGGVTALKAGRSRVRFPISLT